MLKKYGSNLIKYYYDATGICGFNYNGYSYYYRKNIQGDIIAIYDGAGVCYATYAYDAWGRFKIFTNINDIANINPFRYRGYYYDKETSLYYLNARYYDPKIGRFISPDSIEYLAPDSINGLNLYAYCNNNPVMKVDPNGTFGLFTAFLITSIVIGAVMGGAVNTYKAYKEGADGLGLFGAFIGGAIMGGAMGAVMAIGGAAGLASLGITTTVVGGSTLAALGISAGIGITAGLASYTVETLSRSDKEWGWGDFALSGVMGGLQAAATFGISYAGGRAGLFSKPLANMGSAEFLQYIVNTFGSVSNSQALVYATNVVVSNFIARILLCTLPGTTLRALIQKLIVG